METQKNEIYQPLVSIGIPTFNRPESLHKALNSLSKQTYKNIEILISDNATIGNNVEEVVNKFIKNDDRIIFTKQKKNIGLEGNFHYVLNKAKGKYFMWAADDDIRSLDYVENNVFFLEKNLDYVASTSKTKFENSDFNEYKMGDGALKSVIPEERVIKFLETWHANGRIFSLMRRVDLIKAYDDVGAVLASDWIVMLRLAFVGKINRIACGEVVLGSSGTSSNSSIFSIYRTRVIEWIFPFFVLNKETFKLLKDSKIKYKIKFLLNLIKLNYTAFIWQSKYELFQIYKKIK